MLEQSKSRLVFKKDLQNKLLLETKLALGFTNKSLAKFFEITERSFTDWMREKTKLPYSAYIKIPASIQNKFKPLMIVGQYSHTSSAGKKGYKSVIRKYGSIQIDENNRKKAHKRWWAASGKSSSKITQQKQIYLTKDKVKLAELIGIILGDGNISNNQIKISLDSITDKLYILYVSKLLKDVFGVKVSKIKRKDKNCFDLYISRKLAVSFLVNLGMKIGNKKTLQVGVPSFISFNNKLSKWCTRGLIDTDGSLFFENKLGKYSYPRLNFTNASKPLIAFVQKTLKNNSISSKIRRNGLSVQVESFDEICNYFKVFGSSNPKHISKYDILVK